MKKLFIFLICTIAPLLMSAQLPIMDITMVHVDDHYEVRLRPDNGDYQGIFSSIVFTVRWDAASGSIGDFTPSSQAISYGINLTMSGNIATVGGLSYAIFAGFGFQTISPNWTADQEILFGTFPDDGQTNFKLVNDAWTASNNGNYYLSLNGIDRTGVIYQDITTGVQEIASRDIRVSLYPNPTEGNIKLVLDLSKGGTMLVEVVNSTGATVKSKTILAASGISIYDIDMSELASGQYMIRTRVGDQVNSLPCTLQR